MSFKIHFVTGVAASGTELTPVNLNKSSSKAAPDDSVVMAMQGNASTPIASLTSADVIDRVGIEAVGVRSVFELGDLVRLGQGDAIAIEAEEVATTIDTYGVIFGYYE